MGVTKYSGAAVLEAPRAMTLKRLPSMLHDDTPAQIQIGKTITALYVGRGQYTLVDTEDLPRLSAFTWCVQYNQDKGRWDAKTSQFGKRGVNKLMSRFLIDAPPNLTVDHINGNSLDNRKDNLRLATYIQNAANRTKNKNNTSGFKGVGRRPGGRWYAKLQHRGEVYTLGTFDTPEEAARIYDDAARRIHGDFARTNF